MNRPQTLEGWQVWTLAREAPGQIRVGPGGNVMGFDAPALLAMAGALSIPRAAVAAFLPVLDAALCAADRERQQAEQDSKPEAPE